MIGRASRTPALMPCTIALVLVAAACSDTGDATGGVDAGPADASDDGSGGTGPVDGGDEGGTSQPPDAGSDGGEPLAITMGLISDLHLDTTPPVDSGASSTSLANLETAIADWNAVPTTVNVLLGDNVDGNDEASDDASIAAIDAALDTSLAPAYVILGSHDTEQYSTAEVLARFTHMNGSATSYYSLDVGTTHLVFLDDDAAFFGFSEAELAWLEADLAASPYPTIVFVHPRTDRDFPGDPTQYYERGDAQNQLASWSLAGLTAGNSYYFGFYWTLTSSGSTRTVALYTDQARTQLAASGSRSGDGVITLSAQNASGVSGSVSVTYVADDTDTASSGNGIAQGEFTYWPYGEIALNAGDVRQLFETSGKVRFVLNGHLHSNFQADVNGIGYYGIVSARAEASYATAVVSADHTTIVLTGHGAQASY